MSEIRSDNRLEQHPKPVQEYERKFNGTGYEDWASTAEMEAVYNVAYRPNKYFWINGHYFECLSDGVTYRQIDGGGSSQRFGIEDNLGIQNRAVDMQNHTLYITNASELNTSTGDSFGEGTTIFQEATEIDLYIQQGADVSQIALLPTQGITLNTVDSITLQGSAGIIAQPAGSINETFPIPAPGDYFIPLSVNGHFANSAGNIIDPGGVSTIQWSVLDILNAPPVSSVTGDTYLVGTAGTGLWSGHNNEITVTPDNGATWTFQTATVGDILYDANDDFTYQNVTGNTWVNVGKLSIHQGGDSYGAAISIGSIDNFGINLKTHNANRIQISKTGAITLNSLTGVGNQVVGIDATGLLSRVSVGAGTVTSADNALTLSSSTNVQWGASAVGANSPLLHNTYINGAGFFSAFNGGRLEAGQGAAIAAANNLTLGADGNTFSITGATQINAITTTNWQAGSEIHLIFASTPVVKNNIAGGAGTAPILLAGGTDFTAAANDALTFLYDGTNWHETARKLAGSVTSITLAAIGSAPNANAATLSGAGVLNLEPASFTFGGVVTTGTQTFAGVKTVRHDNIITTITDQCILLNAEPATLAVPSQYSPSLVLSGTAWKANSVAASQINKWAITCTPLNGAGTTTAILDFSAAQAGGSIYVNAMTLTGGGVLTTTGNISAGTGGASGVFSSVINGPNGTDLTIATGNASTRNLIFRAGGTNLMGQFYLRTGNFLIQGETGLSMPADQDNAFTVYRNTGLGIGTVTNSAAGTTVTGTNTSFLNFFKIGDQITMTSGVSESQTITAIASNTSMTTGAWTNAHTGDTFVGGAVVNALNVRLSGLIGIGTIPNPNTAKGLFTIAAGTANYGPLQFTAGTNTTTSGAGLMEYDGTNLYFTRTGTTRETITTDVISQTLTNKTLTAPVISSIVNTGTLTLPTVAGTIVQYASASIASSGTPTPTGDAAVNFLFITALTTGGAAFAVPSGTPTNGNTILIRILDDGTARAITWNGIYRASTDLPLPAQTTLSKTMYLKFIYNSASTTWDFVSFLNNF